MQKKLQSDATDMIYQTLTFKYTEIDNSTKWDKKEIR